MKAPSKPETKKKPQKAQGKKDSAPLPARAPAPGSAERNEEMKKLFERSTGSK